MHQQVGAGHQPGDFLRRAEMVDDGDVPGHAGRHVRADQQQVVGLPKVLHAFEQHGQVLLP